MQITAALILGCCALLFVSASALPPMSSWPWAEGDAETESYYGCCSPKIDRTVSVIESLYGTQGHASIVADWGPLYPGKRACTITDQGLYVLYLYSHKT